MSKFNKIEKSGKNNDNDDDDDNEYSYTQSSGEHIQSDDNFQELFDNYLEEHKNDDPFSSSDSADEDNLDPNGDRVKGDQDEDEQLEEDIEQKKERWQKLM